MVHRYRDGRVPDCRTTRPDAAELDRVSRAAPGLIDAALADFDFRRATAAVWRIVDEANRYVNRARPWELATAGHDDDLDAVLARLIHACRQIAVCLTPFLPDGASRIAAQCSVRTDRLPPPTPAFRRLARGV
jgi:methionyl-tRNA synthetase